MYDSEYGLTDDDQIFETYVDKDMEWDGLGSRTALVDEHAASVGELVDINEDDNSDELQSLCSESDSDEPPPKRVKLKKYPAFNDKTNMDNPVLCVGMEFKTHAHFRDAVKEYAIK